MAGYNLKSEEEVKQFLKNLYTEYTFGCYSEKKSDVCHLLGDYLESIDKDFNKAAEIFQKNCDNLDYGRSCAKFGGWRMIGKGCKKDIVDAYKYMRRGCELGDEVGCTNAGIVAISIPEVQNPDKKYVIDDGIKMLHRACNEKKTEKACFFLAGMYFRGINDVVEKNLKESYRYSLKSCEFGNPFACATVAHMHETGEGAQKNEHLAKTFKDRAQELEENLRKSQGIEFGQGIEK